MNTSQVTFQNPLGAFQTTAQASFPPTTTAQGRESLTQEVGEMNFMKVNI